MTAPFIQTRLISNRNFQNNYLYLLELQNIVFQVCLKPALTQSDQLLNCNKLQLDGGNCKVYNTSINTVTSFLLSGIEHSHDGWSAQERPPRVPLVKIRLIKIIQRFWFILAIWSTKHIFTVTPLMCLVLWVFHCVLMLSCCQQGVSMIPSSLRGQQQAQEGVWAVPTTPLLEEYVRRSHSWHKFRNKAELRLLLFHNKKNQSVPSEVLLLVVEVCTLWYLMVHCKVRLPDCNLHATAALSFFFF